jgi:hypothetical protein
VGVGFVLDQFGIDAQFDEEDAGTLRWTGLSTKGLLSTGETEELQVRTWSSFNLGVERDPPIALFSNWREGIAPNTRGVLQIGRCERREMLSTRQPLGVGKEMSWLPKKHDFQLPLREA